MGTGVTVIDIVLGAILLLFIIIGIVIDIRNHRRSRMSKQNVREEISSYIKNRRRNKK